MSACSDSEMDLPTFESLITEQYETYKNLQKFMQNYKKDSKVRKTKAYFEARLESLHEFWREFKPRHRKLILAKGSFEKLSKEASKYFNDDISMEMHECYIIGKSEMQDELQTLHPEAISSPRVPEERVMRVDREDVKLPRINLPNFNGNYNEWNSFRDLFVTLIHDNHNITHVQKLHYLRSTLKGEAEQLLKHFNIIDSNYLPAWKTLNERYNNKRLLIKTQLKTLLGQTAYTQDSAINIRTLLDTTNESLQGLRNLGIDVDSWDTIITYVISEKLPNETKRLWEQSIGAKTEYPTYQELKLFLESQFRTLEALGTTTKKANVVPRQISGGRQSFHISQGVRCALCAGSHSIRLCEQFLKLNHTEKRNIVTKKGLCSNCLRQGHKASSCPSIHSCFHCKHRHHTLLHSESVIANFTTTAPPATTENFISTTSKPSTADDLTLNSNSESTPIKGKINSLHVESLNSTRRGLLATALVRICSPCGLEVVARALVDPGSEVSFLTENLAQTLKLPRSSTYMDIIGVRNQKTGVAKSSAEFIIKSMHDDTQVRATAFIINSITSILPPHEIRIDEDLLELKELCLADPQFYSPGKIDVLLGVDVYCKIMLSGVRKMKTGNLIAQRTTLGWIVSGEVSSPASTNRFVSCHAYTQWEQDLRQFWEIEEVQGERHMTLEEQACENFYTKTVRREKDGRYTVRLPFRNEQRPSLGSSRATALRRFHHLESRFTKAPQMHDEYAKCIAEYEELKHMRPLSASTEKEKLNTKNEIYYESYYLPHHAVFKESTTTKLRVVFDASQKTTHGPSLNETLMVGPKLQDDLLNILLRWRKHKFVFTADIEKMYRQILVDEEDADYQRILWRPSPTTTVQDFCLNTVTFGTACAPYLAIKTLYQLADDEAKRFPTASQTLKTDFYVDDLLTGANTVAEATNLQTELIELLRSAGFNLRQWTTNDARLLNNIPNEDQEISQIHNIEFDEGIKTLGVLWCPKTDAFSYKINSVAHSEQITKRELLSQISRLFDPLGLLAPVVIRSKILMQSVWLSGIDWDDDVPDDVAEAWLELRNDLKKIECIKIPRWLHTTTNEIELHGFCDASTRAYAAVFYARAIDESGNIVTGLLTSKTKVAPIKQVTLARLELCGAVLLVRLFKLIKNALKLDKIHLTLWCDSTIVLSWIKAHPSRWKTFIANRVSEIQSTVDCTAWKFVQSEDNPADCASRGMSPKDLEQHSLWWNGPEWLKKAETYWPTPREFEDTQLEERKNIKVHLTTSCNTARIKLVSKYSSLTKLLRVSCICFRFINKCRRINSHTSPWISTAELSNALTYWVKDAQAEDFEEELKTITSGKSIKGGKIKTLTPFIDKDGVLRVGGRLEASDFSWNEKHPIILSPKHPLTTLIIRDMHTKTLHGGTQLMIGLIRRKFWIVNARNAIKLEIHRCITCFKQRPTPLTQLMGNLPGPRARMSRPFTHVGVDFCGPFNMKASKGRGQKSYKGYLAIFVCLAVRAIHIEVVSDLTTEAFYAALKRFVSRRGMCSDIYSDNGTNFVGTSRTLDKDYNQHTTQIKKEIPQLSAPLRINWHFIPPSSPHFGGLWEAGVKATKYHLKRILTNTALTYEEFTTVTAQIEACLNSRPITPVTDDPEDMTALTPGHFLIHDPPLALPEPSTLDYKINALSRWQYLTHLTQSFWKRWQGEYLSKLQQRPKWMGKSKNLEVGQMVIVKDEKLPPTKWLIGRIVDTHPGADNLVRVVTIKTKDSTFKRPIAKLCLLPLDNTMENENNTNTTLIRS